MMKCKQCSKEIKKGIYVPAPDGIRMTIEYICKDCYNKNQYMKNVSKYQAKIIKSL